MSEAAWSFYLYQGETVRRANGDTIAYGEYGDTKGEPLLFFHGWPSSHTMAELTDDAARGLKLRVVSPVPWCPPVPRTGPLAQYARFRDLPVHGDWNGVAVSRPRFVLGERTSAQDR